MCDGISETMAIASLAMTAVGTGVSMAGQANQANQAASAQAYQNQVAAAQQTAAAEAAQYQAQVAANNATIAQRNAVMQQQAGLQEEQAQGLKTSALIGSQIAGAAGNGLDPTSGSALKLQQDTRTLGSVDAMTIRSNSERKAYAYLSDSANYKAQSELYDQASKSDSAAAIMSANAPISYNAGSTMASTLLSGATSFSDKWSSYSQKLGWGGGSWSPAATNGFGLANV